MALPTNLTKPYTMVGATTANASDVNADLDYITDALNATNLLLNQSAGTTTDLTTRLAVTQNNDGTLKTLGTVGLTGNLTFSGTGNRITGLMSGATRSDRVLFSTNATNSGTSVGAMPNGTSPGSGANFTAYAKSTPDESSFLQLSSNETNHQITGGVGTSTTANYLPLIIQIDNTPAIYITASGTTTPDLAPKVLIGSTTDNTSSCKLQVTGGMSLVTAAVPSTATSSGIAGEIRLDASHIYICTATNTWKRAAISTW